MITVAVLLSFLAHLMVEASPSWKALDPEQTLNAFKHCLDDHLPSGSDRETYKSLWLAWKMEPNDSITHCYLRCALTGLQIYDPQENAFKSERIPVQYHAYKNVSRAQQNEVTEYQQALAAANPKTGSCVDVYNAYLPVHNRFFKVCSQLYHGIIRPLKVPQ